MQDEYIKITIRNWDKFQPRKDIKNPSWFRLNHSIIGEYDFLSLTPKEKLLWIYVLCCASQKNCASPLIIRAQAVQFTVMRAVELTVALKKFNAFGWIEQPRNVNGTYTGSIWPLQDKTDKTDKQNKTTQAHLYAQFFDTLWQKYPKKKDKQAALRALRTKVRVSEFESFEKALDNYIKASEGKDIQYMKFFKTFVSGWQDWENPEQDQSTERDWYEVYLRNERKGETT